MARLKKECKHIDTANAFLDLVLAGVFHFELGG